MSEFNSFSPGDAGDWDNFLDGLARYVEQVQNKIDLVDMALDKIRTQIIWLRQQPAKKLHPGPKTKTGNSDEVPQSSPRPPWKAFESLLKSQAEKGFSCYSVIRLPDLSARVTIGDSEFKVPPALAEILAVLGDSPREEDGFPQWLSLQQISDTLTVEPHALRQRITRLRTLLFRAGSNPYFFETNGRSGDAAQLRLRWRRVADTS
jgi:hypothetical protein